MNLGKSKFCCKELKYLGYLFSTDPEKVQVIEKYSPPTSVTELRSFLGMPSWYQRFIIENTKILPDITREI